MSNPKDELEHLLPIGRVQRVEPWGTSMDIAALFGLSILLSSVAFGIVTAFYIWPYLLSIPRSDALRALIVPHIFRFVGLSFLFPGVVSPGLPHAFAVSAAYGDLVATILAIIAIWALSARAALAIPIVWLFNLWGTADLLNAFYLGEIAVRIEPGSLQSAFFIPTVIVPFLLLMHGLIFRLLIKPLKPPGRHTA